MLTSMTEDQKDALAGKLMFEHGDLTKEIAILDSQAKRFGQAFSTAGQVLTSRPQNLLFDKVSHDARFNGPVVKVEDLDGKKVLELVQEIQLKIVRLQDIAAQLKNMGITV